MLTNLHIENYYFKYKNLIYQYVYKLTDDRDVALDITQQTFLTILDNNVQIGLTPFGLFKIAYKYHGELTHDKNHIQFEKIDQSIELNYFSDKNTLPPSNNMFKVIQLNIENSFNKMPLTVKELLILYFIEDMSIMEISVITQRSVIDVKVNLYHAQILLETTVIKRMKKYNLTLKNQCHKFSSLTKQFFLCKIPSSHYGIINLHLNKCKLCRNNTHLKQTGILLNIIPFFKTKKKLNIQIAKSNTNNILYINSFTKKE